MKKYIMAAVLTAAFALSATAGVIITENWSEFTAGGVVDQTALNGLTNPWSLSGNTSYTGTSGPDGSQNLWLRKTSTLDIYVDVTTHVDATDYQLKLSVDMKTSGFESAESDTGYLRYTTDSGTSWTTVATLDAADTDYASYGFTLDTTTWTADQLTGFGFRFEGVNSHLNDQLHTDNIVLQTVPEPATLGLLAAMGGSILFIRRRFMI